jgi:ABC-2 type transport system ATP-binding protein
MPIAELHRTQALGATMTEPDGMALQIVGVSKAFGKTTALSDVSLDVPAGTCFGLLGPNGAGKSTLIRSIVGRVRPNAGTIKLFGEPANSPKARSALGWAPQELALYPRLTCLENLQAFGRYQGLRGKPLKEAIAWCLDWAGLSDRAGGVVSTLSGGMKRRLNLAAAVIHRPRLVLLDEPTVGVDPQSRNRIFDMVAELRAQGATLIYTTHYMEEVERLCDRIAILDHAQVIALGAMDELITQSFGKRYDVHIHIASGRGEDWARAHGGVLKDGVAQFSIERPTDVAALLDTAEKAGLEVVDVSLRRPNLESVFLHLTGRELRE